MNTTETKHTENTNVGQELSQPKKPKRKLKRFIIRLGYFFIVIIVCGLAAIGLKIHTNLQAAEKQEELDYAVLCPENYNIQDYSDFLSKYPESKYYRKAKQRLTELKTLDSAWQTIKNSKNENEFVNFKNQYKDPYYAQLCNQKLDTIDWVSAKADNTPEAYQRYINRHPKGRYMTEAIIAKTEVGFMAINEQEESAIYSVCNNLFSTLGLQNNEETILSLLAPNVNQFMTLQQPTNEDIVKWLQDNYDNEAFVTYLIHKEYKMKKDITEDHIQFYTAELTIDKISTDNQGKENTETYTAILNLDKEFRISSLTCKDLLNI